MSQIFRIHSENPQKRLLEQVISVLKKGGLIAFPTDSGYLLGCLLENKSAFEKICKIRNINKNHNLTLMCRDLSELSQYAYVNNISFRLIKNNTPGSYVFILKATREVPNRLMNKKRETIGLRIPDNKIDLVLLELLAQPLMTSTLILPGDKFALSNADEIIERVGGQLDAIIDGGHIGQKPTTIIDLTGSYPVVVRYGNGDVTPFE